MHAALICSVGNHWMPCVRPAGFLWGVAPLHARTLGGTMSIHC
jgi:hypothetical protein